MRAAPTVQRAAQTLSSPCLTLAPLCSLPTFISNDQYRWNMFKGIRDAIDQNEGGMDKFSQGGCPGGGGRRAHLFLRGGGAKLACAYLQTCDITPTVCTHTPG